MKKTYFLIIFVLLISTVFAEEAPKFIYNDELFEIGDTNVSIFEKIGAPKRIYYEAFEQNPNSDLISYEYRDKYGKRTVFSFYRGSEVIVLMNSDSNLAGIKTENSSFICGKTTKTEIEKYLGKGILVSIEDNDTLIYEYSFSNKNYPSFPIDYQFFYKDTILSSIVVNFINF